MKKDDLLKQTELTLITTPDHNLKEQFEELLAMFNEVSSGEEMVAIHRQLRFHFNEIYRRGEIRLNTIQGVKAALTSGGKQWKVK